VSISCCGLVGDGDEAGDKDWLENGEPGNREALRARRGMQRSKRETRFIMWRKEWTLSRIPGHL
jgi:hypothetical protein